MSTGVKTTTPTTISGFYTKPVEQKDPVYNLPPVISKEHVPTFIEQAKIAGVSPDEFGIIARREQGANTLPHQAAMVGGVDPADKGVMQVNKINEPLIQKKFQEELGRTYNPFNALDSIIGARMVLEENRRQFDQMIKNKTFSGPYTNKDLIDSYNLGVKGIVQAKSGNKEKTKKLTRYQNAGK